MKEAGVRENTFRAARVKAGLTQEQDSHRVGSTQAVLAEFEPGDPDRPHTGR